MLGSARGKAQVNAQVGTGAGWGGEAAIIRLAGEVVSHADSVVLPLLLPDSPVAIWWPHDPPADPAADPLGALAQRRITDAAEVTGARRRRCDPVRVVRRRQHRPGLDPDHAVAGAARRLPRPAPAQGHLGVGHLRADQPQRRPARRVAAQPAQDRGRPARARRARHHRGRPWRPSEGPIRISRTDGRLATFSSPDRPDRPIALKRRELPELLAEELRRLDEDDVYAATDHARMVKMATTR